MANCRTRLNAVVKAPENILYQPHTPFIYKFSLLAPADAGAFLAPMLQGNEAHDGSGHCFSSWQPDAKDSTFFID